MTRFDDPRGRLLAFVFSLLFGMMAATLTLFLGFLLIAFAPSLHSQAARGAAMLAAIVAGFGGAISMWRKIRSGK